MKTKTATPDLGQFDAAIKPSLRKAKTIRASVHLLAAAKELIAMGKTLRLQDRAIDDYVKRNSLLHFLLPLHLTPKHIKLSSGYAFDFLQHRIGLLDSPPLSNFHS